MSSLRDMLAGLQMPLDDGAQRCAELVVWQGRPMPPTLRELAQLRNGSPGRARAAAVVAGVCERGLSVRCTARQARLLGNAPCRNRPPAMADTAFAIDETGQIAQRRTRSVLGPHPASPQGTQPGADGCTARRTGASGHRMMVCTAPFGTTSLRPPAPPPANRAQPEPEYRHSAACKLPWHRCSRVVASERAC